MSGLKRIPAAALNLLYPDECRVCDEPLRTISRIPVCPYCLLEPKRLAAEFYCRQCLTPFPDDLSLDEQDLCKACREGLVHFDSVYSFGRYEDPLCTLIQTYKYNKVVTLAEPLSRLLLRALPLDRSFDLVIPMPMHWRKRWQRGFNQAELLARPVARHLGIPLARNLKRTRYTKAQAGLGNEERQENLKQSFAVAKAENLANKRILLIDDVFTTGATLQEAARTLKTLGGVARVCALTLARVDVGLDKDGGSSPRKSRRAGITRPEVPVDRSRLSER